jgi:hypothetical protein
MDRIEIIILVSVLVFAGFRLYQKYVKNAKGKSQNGNRGISGNSDFSVPSGDDDYEPYSKK